MTALTDSRRWDHKKPDRFVARRTGPEPLWGVYDRAVGSWPIQRPGLGIVRQGHLSRASAEAEAARCHHWYLAHGLRWDGRSISDGDLAHWLSDVCWHKSTQEPCTPATNTRMGSVVVDQIGPGGELIEDVDTTLSSREKDALLTSALPGATIEAYAGDQVVRFRDQVILRKQVTHLGNPWPGFKKRIQIPKSWLAVARQAATDGLAVRFVGIYHYAGLTIFVDFDPATYVLRKANNSAAHVSTNDLYQAQTLGQFSRVDRKGNRLTSIRADQLASYLLQGYEQRQPRLDVFHRFNLEFLHDDRVESLDAVKEMHAASWPDTFQGEWPGFYVEFRLDSFIRNERLESLVEYQKIKQQGAFDYDLVFKSGDELDFYGDLKASDATKNESPGNDAMNIRRCIKEFGRFWYVIYEHDTTHARDNGNQATIAWNEWKRSVGYQNKKPYDPLSYAKRFKESVRFVQMMVLEVNEANSPLVLGDFAQGKQPDGAARALKVMIKKRNIDNFLIYTETPSIDRRP